MKVLLLLAAMILTFGPIHIQGSFQQYSRMITRVTARSETEYSNYGCHCGHDGRGTPKDVTDGCCLKRKCCYRTLRRHGCNTTNLDYFFFFHGNNIICYDTGDFCEKYVCECDKVGAICLAANSRSYNPEYRGYNNTFCQGYSREC